MSILGCQIADYSRLVRRMGEPGYGVQIDHFCVRADWMAP